MDDSCHREVLIKQSNFIIIKLILEKDALLPKHKARGLTTLIPLKGEGMLTRNAETIAIRRGINIDLTPNDEHDILAKTVLELLVIEVF